MTLDDLVCWLIRNRFATLESAWDLTLSDIRRAIELAHPPGAATPPSRDDLAVLMRTFPDNFDTLEPPHGRSR